MTWSWPPAWRRGWGRTRLRPRAPAPPRPAVSPPSGTPPQADGAGMVAGTAGSSDRGDPMTDDAIDAVLAAPCPAPYGRVHDRGRNLAVHPAGGTGAASATARGRAMSSSSAHLGHLTRRPASKAVARRRVPQGHSMQIISDPSKPRRDSGVHPGRLRRRSSRAVRVTGGVLPPPTHADVASVIVAPANVNKPVICFIKQTPPDPGFAKTPLPP